MTSRWPGSQRDVNGGAALLDAHRDVAADERERRVRAEHAGEQAGLAEDLEAVADPEHGPALGANAATARITGEKRAIAPQRR